MRPWAAPVDASQSNFVSGNAPEEGILERAMGIEPTALCLGSRAVEGGRADEVDRSALEPSNGGHLDLKTLG